MRGIVFFVTCLFIIMGLFSPLSAVMYRWTDQKGIEHITNTKPPPDAINVRTYGEDDPAPPDSAKPEPKTEPKRTAPEKSVISDSSKKDAKAEAEMLKCVPLGALFIQSMKKGIIITDMNDVDLATIGIHHLTWEKLSKKERKNLLREFSSARRECEGEGTIVLKDVESGQTLGLATPQGIELLK